MTDPTPLSPAAQSVWDAAWANSPVQCGDIEGTRRAQVAAALRAAVEQVVPLTLEEELFCRNHSLSLQKMVEIRLQLLAVADELEGAQ